MNELKVVIEQTGNSYTLKPKREYAIGSGPDCDIRLPTRPDISSAHAKFSFDEFDKTWYVYDLGSTSGTFVGTERISDYPILNKTQIILGSEIYLVATPVGSETITQVQYNIGAPTPPPIYSEPSSYPTTMPAITPKVSASAPDRKLIRAYFECLKERNNAPKETELLGTKIIDDLLSSLEKSSWPQGYGIIAVPFLVIVAFLLLAQQVGWAIFVIVVFFSVCLIPGEIPPNLPTPPVTDEQIFKWLEMDLEKLIEKGQVELRIMTTTGENLGNLLDGEPITLMSGVSKKLDQSSFLELVRFLDMVKKDYFVEKGLDGQTQYSIYDFLAIYPCKNFIAYYRCKWNFIRGVSLQLVQETSRTILW
jgi:FHA domain